VRAARFQAATLCLRAFLRYTLRVADESADLKRDLQRLRRLYEVGEVIHSTLDPQLALKLIVQEAVGLMDAHSGSVALINPTTGFLDIEAAENLPPEAARLHLRLGEGITGWVGRTGRPARVGEVLKDPRYVMVRDNIRSELAVPLLVEGEVRGVINVDSDRADAFSQSDQELLEQFAAQASRVVANTWRYEQLRLRSQLLESLVAIGQTINSTVSLDEVLQGITREATELMHARMCSLMLLDATGEWLDLRASHGAGPAYLGKPRLSAVDSLLGTVVRRRRPLQVGNVQTSSQYQHVETARVEGLVSLLSVPLSFGEKSIGVLSVYTGEPRQFSDDEVRSLIALAQFSAIAIQKAQLYERIVDAEEQLRGAEKLSALGMLAAEVAHEIRNPLTVMKMLYHSLDLRFAGDDPRNRDAEIISSKMDLLNKIVEQILDFARSAEPRMAPVDLNRSIEDLTLLTRHKLRNQRVQLKLAFDPALPPVSGDASQLEQAFLNLTLNAVEAMPSGGTLTIATGTAAQGPRKKPAVWIEFADTGVGMSEERRRNAFTNLLSTTKPGGSGIGLALVGRIVETHGGVITVESTPGAGTRIRIGLPAA
jgi:signal transduction histidine kinase